MPTVLTLSPVQCYFVYVVCTPLSLRQFLYKFDACRHDSRQPPGMTVPPGPLSSLRS